MEDILKREVHPAIPKGKGKWKGKGKEKEKRRKQ